MQLRKRNLHKYPIQARGELFCEISTNKCRYIEKDRNIRSFLTFRIEKRTWRAHLLNLDNYECNLVYNLSQESNPRNKMNISMSDDIRHDINHNNNRRDGPAIVSRIFYSILQTPFTPVSVQMAIALKKMAIASN